MEVWIELVKAFGYPTAVSVVMAIAIAKFLKWCAPRADRVVDAHIGALTSMQESQATMVKTQEDIKELIVHMDRGEKIDKIHDGVGELLSRGCAAARLPTT